MDYTVHGILQGIILEWVAFPFFRGSSWPRNLTRVSCIAGGSFTNWDIREAHGTMDWFKIGKVRQGCILLPCLLTSMQSTSCEMPGWMTHKLESRLLGEISTISDMQMIPLKWQKWRGTKELLDEGKRAEWKSWMETQHSKRLRPWHLVPWLHGKQKVKKWKQCQFFFFNPKLLQTMTAALKWKDTCSLEGKLWQTSTAC